VLKIILKLAVEKPLHHVNPYGSSIKKFTVYAYTLNVMFQVPVTFEIYLVFKNTWEAWGNYFDFPGKL
jgi:hypothetical protein